MRTSAVFLLLAALHLHSQDENLPFDVSNYTLKESFKAGDSDVQLYVAKSDPGEGWLYFLVRPKTGASWLYRMDAGKTRLSVFLMEADAERAAQTPPPRVMTRKIARKDVAVAREMIVSAEAATADWDAHKAFLDQACSTETQTAHEGWRKIAGSLERARQKYPEHLGILRDMIIAYSRLNAFESDTPRGTNLCLLIPNCISEFNAAAGVLTPDEELTFRRTLAKLYFEIGLYPVASSHIDQSPDDPQLATLRKAMEALSQFKFRVVEEFEVAGELLTYRVTAHQADAEAPADKTLFHLLTFVTRPGKDSTAPGQVWYTLSCQTLKDAPRYYLYACTANVKKVVALYGRERPSYDEVKEKVKELMIAALRKSK